MGFGEFLLLLYVSMLSLLSLVGVPMPFSVPPLPEDPALLRIAPKDSICCFTWSGAAIANARSSNQTEQLCAEPEVAAAIRALRDATKSSLGGRGGAAANGLVQGGIAQGSFDLACAALQRPGCVFLRSAQRHPRPRLEAGLALKLGDQIATAKALLGGVTLALRSQQHDGETHEDVDVDDVRFRALPTAADHTFVGWAEVDGWLLVAVGAEVPGLMLAGLRGTSEGLRGNADFQRLNADRVPARPATRTFVDCARLQAMLRDTDHPHMVDIAAALGFANATTALATTGLDGDGFCTRLRIDVPEHTGLLGALGGEPITQDALMAVPLDADVAVAMRVDPVRLQDSILALFGSMFGAGVRREFEQFQREFEAEFGFTWQDGAVGQLDGQLTAWNAPSQGGIGFTAAAGRLGLRDGAAFAQPFGTFMGKFRAHVGDKAKARAARNVRRNGTYLESFTHGDHTVHWIDDLDDDVPFAWSWSAGPNALTMAMSPQGMRATLDAVDAPNPDHSIVRLPALNRRGTATLLVHLDFRALLAESYPLLMMLFQSSSYEWQRDGFDFDAADLPRPSSLLPHLGQELSRLEPTATGFAFTRTGTVPVFDPMTVMVAAAVGTALAVF